MYPSNLFPSIREKIASRLLIALFVGGGLSVQAPAYAESDKAPKDMMNFLRLAEFMGFSLVNLIPR
jgi:hypothetical protein